MISNNVRLNTHQKTILAIIAYSATSKLAANDVSSTPNLNQNTKILSKLGLVQYNDNELSFTEAGKNIAIQENIIDSMGELTINGQVYLKLYVKTHPAEHIATESLISEMLLKHSIKRTN